MAQLDSIGIVELSSVAAGYLVQDAMLKAAAVELLVARTICSGKYLIVIAGDVASVTAAVDTAGNSNEQFVIERRVLSKVHPAVFPAVGGNVSLEPGKAGALGVIETFSAASIIDVADAAAKSANVVLLRIHLAMALGGKGFVQLTGDVASVRAAVDAGSRIAAGEGILVANAVIPAPRPELFQDYI